MGFTVRVWLGLTRIVPNHSAFRKRNTCRGRTIFIADAHRDDRKRFVVRADAKPTAFMEFESATRACRELS
jgi:hypothetical protein